MKDQNTVTLPVKAGDTRLALARRVDEIASGAMALFKEAGSFEAELGIAQAMHDLRLALTDDMMAPIMSLMNTDLGFRTDRDPKLNTDKDGKPVAPYAVDVVRDCVIEAKMRGFHTVGNEFNIIAGRFYGARNGLKRKCDRWEGVTDLCIDYGVPKMQERGAVVPVRATWIKDGVSCKIPEQGEWAEIPVRVNAGMGADAILGKCERKIYKRIHDRLSGTVTPDGEAGDESTDSTQQTKESAAAKVRFDKAKPANVSKVETTTAPAVDPSKAATVAATPSQSQPSASPEGKSSAPNATTNAPRAGGKTLVEAPWTPSDELGDIVTSAGYTFDDFVKWAKTSGRMEPGDNPASFAALPPHWCKRIAEAKAGLLAQLAMMKGQ